MKKERLSPSQRQHGKQFLKELEADLTLLVFRMYSDLSLVEYMTPKDVQTDLDFLKIDPNVPESVPERFREVFRKAKKANPSLPLPV